MIKKYNEFINENNTLIIRNINIFNNQTETNVFQSGTENFFGNRKTYNNWNWEDFLNYQKIIK